MNSYCKYACAAALTFSALGGAPVLAADPAIAESATVTAPVDNLWTFSVAPYFWAAGIRGDVGARDRGPVSVDVPFRDIFDNLRFGGMVVGEAHNGTWGVFTDLIYLKIEADRSLTGTLGGAPLNLSGTLETTSVTATLMGQYRALATQTASLDIMAGVRVWSVDNQLSLGLTAGGTPVAAFTGTERQTWVDPMIGAKSRVDLTSSWFLTGWAMIGGFGASSNLSWDLMGGIGYQWNNAVSFIGGYRALSVDYNHDGFEFDVTQQGPVLGAIIRF